MAAVVSVAAAVAAAGGPAPARNTAAVPSASQVVTVGYSGHFDLTNKAVPQLAPHSSDYRLEWSFWWSGTWGKLFRDRSIYSGPVRFSNVLVSGTLTAKYRERNGGPLLTCTTKIVDDPAA